MMTSLRCYSIIVALNCFNIEIRSVTSDEIKDNTFTATLIGISTTTWTNDRKEAKFTNAIATVANDYCSSNYDQCGLKTWNSSRSFRASHVKISSGYPKQDHQNLQVQFHVELPSGTDIRKNYTNVVPESTIGMIIRLKGTTLTSLIGVKVKLKENATSKPKVDNKMNFIMIPVSFGLLGILILLVFCLQYFHKRKVKDIKASERRRYSSSKERTGTLNSQSLFLGTSTVGIPKVAVKPQRREDPSTQVYCESETKKSDLKQQESIFETHGQSPHSRKEKAQKHRSHKEDNLGSGVLNKGCDTEQYELNPNFVNRDGSDQESLTKKPERKRKKRNKKRRELAPDSQEHKSEQEAAAEEEAESNNISSKLPSLKHKRPEDFGKQVTQDQNVVNENDEERQQPKQRTRRKKRHKKRVESPVSQDDELEKEKGNVRRNESDDIFSRLPPPRKLPPL